MSVIVSNFLTRNVRFCVASPRKAWATRKAMAEYRKEHPICEYDRRSYPVHVHHKLPIKDAPWLAADPTNFISLGGKRNHLVVGHGGNWRSYVANVTELCARADIVRQI